MGESEKLAGIRDAQLMFGTNSRHVCSNKESPALVFVALLWSNVEIPKGDYLYTHFLSSRTSFFFGGKTMVVGNQTVWTFPGQSTKDVRSWSQQQVVVVMNWDPAKSDVHQKSSGPI